ALAGEEREPERVAARRHPGHTRHGFGQPAHVVDLLAEQRVLVRGERDAGEATEGPRPLELEDAGDALGLAPAVGGVAAALVPPASLHPAGEVVDAGVELVGLERAARAVELLGGALQRARRSARIAEPPQRLAEAESAARLRRCG